MAVAIEDQRAIESSPSVEFGASKVRYVRWSWVGSKAVRPSGLGGVVTAPPAKSTFLLDDLFTFRRLLQPRLNLVSGSFDPLVTTKENDRDLCTHQALAVRNVPPHLLSAFRASPGQPGPSVPGRQPSESRSTDAGCPVAVPPPLSQQDAAQALLHGGERRSTSF